MTTQTLIAPLARRYGALLVLALAAATAPAGAATSADAIWSDIDETRIAVRGQRVTIPDRYRAVQADVHLLERALQGAPQEGAGAGAVLHLPMPDGSFQTFEVWNSPIMADALAKQFPEIRTFAGIAKGDSATTARFDLTPAGFHGMILGPQGTVYIDPYQMGSRSEYISYDKHDYRKMREPHTCSVTGKKVDADHSPLEHVRVPIGDTLRSYRIAVAATGEYTAFHGGTVGAGQAAIVTTMNRVNLLYERDLAVRMNLVANNSTVVYTNGATDPYTNFDGFAMLGENQTNLDLMIGSANYDIGHVVSTGGGGIAGLGVVCNNARKGEGVTGSSTPVGDPFDVDFVAHEIGHQFDGNHTFNGTTGACGGGNRNAGTAYEPGSGTTVQAYAGICGAENIQLNSDDNFHGASYDEMTAYISGAGSCFTGTATGNAAPTVNAGANRLVPANTPLILGSDASANDAGGQSLTYSWEQFDLGGAAPPNTDDGFRPLFRSFKPQVTPIRYLPQMSDILNNTTTLGESLPTTSRQLNFRMTVRDNVLGGGGVDFDSLILTVVNSAGPFAVTSQSTASTWPQNSSQTVTWNVANTTGAGVNCANVSIIFSDFGFTNFSGTTLVASTPNDGSHTFNIGALPNTTTGRVMVKCATNIFFDVNDADITVTGGGGPVCGNGLIEAPEQCDDNNTNGGDGCSAICEIEPGFTCTGQPSVCTPIGGGNTCLSEDFEAGLGNWTAFNTGATNVDWGTTDDNFCWSVNVGVPVANVTGGTGEAACVDSDAAGGEVVAYLCSPQFNAGQGDNDVELKFNYQIFQAAGPDDFFNLLVGTAAPSAGTIGGYTELFTTSANAGNFAALPGATLSGPVTGANGLDLYLCVGYGGDFDWYAQVDEVRWTASGGCGAQQNNPPVLNAIGDQTILIPAGGQFVVSATDPDGDELTFSETNLPFFCTLTDGGPGNDTATIACNTNPGNVGVYNVTVTVTDDGAPPLDDSEQFAIVIELDSDGDGIRDIDDNCTMVANPDQRDDAGDGFGTLCDGDFNNDCNTNAVDLGIFRTVFFTNTGFADYDGNNIVNAVDLGYFKTLFFMPPGPSGLAACP